MSEHTKEPWNADVSITDKNGWELPKQIVTISSGEKLIARYSTDYGEFPCDSENEANARRIVACVNACDGYSTEALEEPGGFMKSFGDALEQRDKLLEALRRIASWETDNGAVRIARETIAEVEAAK